MTGYFLFQEKNRQKSYACMKELRMYERAMWFYIQNNLIAHSKSYSYNVKLLYFVGLGEDWGVKHRSRVSPYNRATSVISKENQRRNSARIWRKFCGLKEYEVTRLLNLSLLFIHVLFFYFEPHLVVLRVYSTLCSQRS